MNDKRLFDNICVAYSVDKDEKIVKLSQLFIAFDFVTDSAGKMNRKNYVSWDKFMKISWW